MTINTFIAITLILLQLAWWVWIFRPKRRAASTNDKRILFASESGQAQKLAKETQKQLGQDWAVLSLSDFLRSGVDSGIHKLANSTTVFVVSTTGDGDAPENGQAFFKQLISFDGKLDEAEYAVLALGDTEYPKFCQFGIDLDAQLKRIGATPLFELLKVDNLAPATLTAWSEHLAKTFSVAQIEIESNLSDLFTAQLSKRDCINPDSPAEGLYELSLTVPSECAWEGGDIVQVTVPQDKGESVMREYSIGNAHREGDMLDLLVRQVVIDESTGQLGRGSGFLTKYAELTEHVDIRIRKNSAFKLPSSPTPMILIATGSGLAGVASILDEADKHWSKPFNEHQGGHWLIYGERYPEHENPFADRLADWQARGVLSRVTQCFSRTEKAYPKYVHGGIAQHSGDIKEWLTKRNAKVYVCGSKEKLGQSIPVMLAEIVGRDIREQLQMDVY